LLILLTMAAAPIPARDVPALSEKSDPAEKARVQHLINEARRIGTFSWISGAILPGQGAKITRAFQAYYGLNDLKTNYLYASTFEVTSRVEQLLMARRNTFDVVWNAAYPWYPDLLRRGELLRYESPNYKAFTLSEAAGYNMHGYWVSFGYAFTPAYNPAALRKLGITNFQFSSYKDLVNPRLKGLVSIGNLNSSMQSTSTMIALQHQIGGNWFRRLVSTVKPTPTTVAAQGRDWLASGEFPIAITTLARDRLMLRQKHIDIRSPMPKEGVLIIPFPPVILKSALNPAAAKLFIDYITSIRGAQMIQDAGAMLFVGRPGVRSPAPDILPAWENVKVIPFNWVKDGSRANVERYRDLFYDADG